MPRRVSPISNSWPVHINARTVNKELFKVPMEYVWETMENHLHLVSKLYSLRIHSFVLMPNHFHLLVNPREQNLGEALNYFMRETSKQLGRLSGRINQVYGGRAYKTLITSERHFLIAYKYVYRNPVRAGLSSKAEDYPYSTLSFLCGRTQSIIPVELDTLLFSPEFSQRTIEWLNTAPKDHHQVEVANALRRSVFKLARDKNSKRPSSLEAEPF